jgi:4-hydroxyphenylacetate 3-monooxygenase
MSRLSDYARAMVTGWYAVREEFRPYDTHFPEKILRYYEEARDNDLFVTTAVLDPQINRARRIPEHDPDAVLRIVRETEEGVIVRGAKMVATGGPYAHDFLVFPFHRLCETDRSYAHALIVPANSPGLHIVCRESFASVDAENHPLSSRFEEMDAVLFFDDVLVPWERVLLKGDPEAVWRLRMHPSANAIAYHQTIVRSYVKLKFVAAVGCAIAKAIGVDGFLHVQEKLGELLTQAETMRALVIAAEASSQQDTFGNQIPALEIIEAGRNLNAHYYPRAIELLQQIGAGGFVQLPADVAEVNGPLQNLMHKYLAGANVGAESKVKLFKLAWDLIGSPLGSRHVLYERFYAGDPVRMYANTYLSTNVEELCEPVWRLIGEPVLR